MAYEPLTTHHTAPRSGRPCVHYVERPSKAGSSPRRAIVLVHGLGGRWQHYEPVLPHLAEHARVLAVDLPGFGTSPQAKTIASIDDHVDAIAAVLDHAAVDEAVLAGHSMGGPLALRFAARHPGRAAALVLVCGTVQSFQQTLARRIQPWVRAPRTAIATLAELVMTATPLPPALHEILARTRVGRRLALWPFVRDPVAFPAPYAAALVGGAGAPGALPTARALGHITGWEHARPTGVPALYAINGAFDRIAPLDDLERFPLPFERTTVLQTGHMAMLEAPEPFAHELGRIFADTWA